MATTMDDSISRSGSAATGPDAGATVARSTSSSTGSEPDAVAIVSQSTSFSTDTTTQSSSNEADHTMELTMTDDNDIDWNSYEAHFPPVYSPLDASPGCDTQLGKQNQDLGVSIDVERKYWHDLRAEIEEQANAGLPSTPEILRSGPNTISHGEDETDRLFDDVVDYDPGCSHGPKRQLRDKTNQKPVFRTWMDQDKTGDYDPDEEARQQRLKRRRFNAPGTRRNTVDESSSEQEPPRQPMPIPKLIVPIIFGSEHGKSKFADLVTGIEASENSGKAGYKLRTQEKRRVVPSRTDDDTRIDLANVDLRAKPFARGCVACVTLTGEQGEPTCSLVHDEMQWPCLTCLEDDHDCELVVPPVQKQACESCKRRKLKCSFKTTRNHGKTCTQCAASRYPCIAGPAKDSIRTRIRLDRDWELDPLRKKKGKARMPPDCLECRLVGGPCTYPPDEEGAPCIDCKWAGLACTIDGEISESSTPADALDFDFGSLLTQSPAPKTPTPEPVKKQPARKSRGKLITIRTNFSHPIQFNCDDVEEQKHPNPSAICHFCAAPSLPFFGLGEKSEVEVIDFDDNRGFKETKNGHQADGIESTRLCSACTTSRLSIIMCSRHETRPISGVNISLARQERMQNALLENRPGASDAFCGLCPSLAAYECKAEQDGCRGCGLRMCETCGLTLERQFDGDLKVMLEGVESGRVAEPEQGWRADCEMLKGEGVLVRHLRQMCSQ